MVSRPPRWEPSPDFERGRPSGLREVSAAMSLSSMADEDEVAPLLRWHIKYGGRPPLPSLREAIVRALPDLDEETLIDVKLICTELVTNVYQHARTDGELRITRRGGGVICIEVDDNSPRLPLVASGPPHQRR